jgi:hypothetical protein
MTARFVTLATLLTNGIRKKTQSASLLIVKPMELVSKILCRRKFMSKSKSKMSPKDIHVRLIFVIGTIVAVTFAIICLGLLWTFTTVTQPLVQQAPNDKAIIGLLSTIVTFIAGSLGGLLASNGFKQETAPIKKDEAQDEVGN